MTAGQTPFRSAFTDDTWQRFLAAGERVLLDGGTVLLRRGDPPSSVYLLEAGGLEAIDPRTSPPTVLGVFAAGALLGELSFLDGSPVSADVRVRGSATAMRFSIEALREALDGDPAIDAAFHRGVSRLLVDRTRNLTSSAVRGSIGQRDDTKRTVEITLDATSSGPARRVHMWMARGFDPHVATAITDCHAPTLRYPLVGDHVLIGSGEDCDVVLPDVRIDPVHADLIRGADGWRVVSRGARAVVVDAASVSSAPLPQGTPLHVGRYTLHLEGEEVVVEAPAHCFTLTADGLGRTIGETRILDGVSFTLVGGEVIALIGPSGAGKTTLLDALRGNADRGTVTMDGVEFAGLLRQVPSIFGEVPQDDIVVPELTVEESLRSAAKLRLPHRSAAERETVVNRVLNELGLDPIRTSRIGDPERRGISGGQRKRVNIAQELLTDDTRVLLLDEPTSGLDPRSAADIARLARRLADQGKVVLMVTHDISAAVLDQVDHLIVLVPGGRLAFFGPAPEAANHFGAPHAAGIFDRLTDRTPDQWVEHYRASETAALWVDSRTRVESKRLGPAPAPSPTVLPSTLAQMAILTARNTKVKLRDPTSLLVLLAQPLLVAAVIFLVFPQPNSGLVFLLVLACFWFGMSASVRELIADQVLWRREQRLGLSPVAWVGSKSAVVGTAVALQCLALTAVAWMSGELTLMLWPGEEDETVWTLATLGFSAPALAATAVLVGQAGMATGMLVSAVFRRSEAAVGTIVLLLVPQIAFSGILMPLSDTGEVARVLSRAVTPVRYGFDLALRCGTELAYQRPAGAWATRDVLSELYTLGLKPSDGDGLPPEALTWFLATWVGTALALAVVRLATRRS